jgi:hypothetical protein
MTRIVSYVHRYKRPPRKRKAVALDVPAVVTARSVGNRQMPPVKDKPEPTAPPPANDDDSPTEPAPRPAARKQSAIVSTTSRKRLKLLHAEERSAQRDDPEAMARVRAFFARNVRPGGPLPPKRR